MQKIVIVGASFAGSLLAQKLAGRVQVTLVDRMMPGSHLTCAGGMPRDFFEALELDIPFSPVKRVLFSFENRSEIDFPCDYIATDRQQLDHGVWQKAIASGAEFIHGSYCDADPAKRFARIRKRDGEIVSIPFDRLVLACGCNRKAITQAGFRGRHLEQLGSARVEMIDLASPWPETFLVHFRSGLVGGYCWVFPMAGQHLNVGGGSYIGLPFSEKDLAHFKDEFHVQGRVSAKGGGAVPTRPSPTVELGPVVLFGDAAGMVNPLNGEGLKTIAQHADIWADAIVNEKNLNRIWQRCYKHWGYSSASQMVSGMVTIEQLTGIRLYRHGSKLAAKWFRLLGHYN